MGGSRLIRHKRGNEDLMPGLKPGRVVVRARWQGVKEAHAPEISKVARRAKWLLSSCPGGPRPPRALPPRRPRRAGEARTE